MNIFLEQEMKGKDRKKLVQFNLEHSLINKTLLVAGAQVKISLVQSVLQLRSTQYSIN